MKKNKYKSIRDKFKRELHWAKEAVLWKADENIKGLTKRYMYDAEFVENKLWSFIEKSLNHQRKEMREKIEKMPSFGHGVGEYEELVKKNDILKEL